MGPKKRLKLGLYRHRPPPTKPVKVEPICPPQTSTTDVRHGGQQRFSSTEVSRYGFQRRFLDSDEHWTAPICLYIYKTWDFYPLQVISKIPIPTHNTKPTTILAFYLQAPLFLLPPRSDHKVVVFASIAWWSITRLDFTSESIDGYSQEIWACLGFNIWVCNGFWIFCYLDLI